MEDFEGFHGGREAIVYLFSNRERTLMPEAKKAHTVP